MLERVCHADGTFQELERQWTEQCEAYDEDLAAYAAPHLELAKKISEENPQDSKYGIFALKSGGEYSCLMHVNVARLPKTEGKTLRILWILLAPKYDFEDIERELLARLSAEIVLGALGLAAGALGSDQIKVHLGNIGDRQYFTGFCAALVGADVVAEAAIRGNWLHVKQ
ncbi:hypothetical protein [Hyphomicrobium sp. DMF-1]|jgi:hypothetical protein|uniref:hypothetical protein n=1 Tax=Hyphomicrobium sp. DMF-1 TaxID=3019544 RepID=UPI0022EBF640|nr:hypothetical protein [Hyphomicrobium sp. DMF-1]WBT39071.1 hypothetical protein PE058_04115 [Hyphomicrobium sp. DMF-1]